MRKAVWTRASGICLIAVWFLLFAGAASTQTSPPPARNVPFPEFQLPAPQDEMEARYLGIPESGTFRVGDIRADVVLIEILSVYCPYCQRVAPLVDEVYKKIQADPALKGKVKLIGIGMSNSAYELDLFKEKYKVPFPLFPDPNSEISKKFRVPGTPTFIGVKVDRKGGVQEVFYRPGAFTDASQFLADLTKAAGLK